MDNEPKHIGELQALRGIAAFAVMIGHCLIYYDIPPLFSSIALFFNGRSAVVVFFVLSGYVLTRSWRDTPFNRANILRFYMQRAFRIYPAVWAASAFGLLYLVFLHWQIPVADTSAFFKDRFRADRFNMLFIVLSFAGIGSFILPQLWSICIEIIASFALPGIAFMVMHRSRIACGVLAVFVAASFVYGEQSYYQILLYFMDFLVGAFIAMPGGFIYRVAAAVPARAVFWTSLLGLSLTQYLPLDYFSPFAHLAETILAAVAVGILVAAKTRIPVMRSKALLFLGDISYSIYLLHFIVLCVLAKALAVMEAKLGFTLSTTASSIFVTMLAVALTVPLAWLSYSYIERPGIRMGKSVMARLQWNKLLMPRTAS